MKQNRFNLVPSTITYIGCAPTHKHLARIEVVARSTRRHIAALHYGRYVKTFEVAADEIEPFIGDFSTIRLSIDHLPDDQDVVITLIKSGHTLQMICPADELVGLIEFHTEEEANLVESEARIQKRRRLRQPRRRVRGKFGQLDATS